jgi:thiamine biosynthesis lipoprotein
MSAPHRLPRRRALQIVATAAGLAFAGGIRASGVGRASNVHTWRGLALGARASITLCHPDGAYARRLLRRCTSEIARLEDMFSLYRRESEITRLNRYGFLDGPSADLVQLLSTARAFGDVTRGAFDPTVQPLWTLYAEHFAQPARPSRGPEAAAIERALELIDYRNVSVAGNRIEFEHSGMAITLNGIAQGYITDRVADLLRSEGLDDVLVDLGEIRGVGRHADGRPWTVGIEDPLVAGRLADTLVLENRAVASSAGAATRFDEHGQHHHLFDPATGASTRRYAGVTVVAERATTADALSTGFASMDLGDIDALLGRLTATSARMTSHAGEVVTLSGPTRKT